MLWDMLDTNNFYFLFILFFFWFYIDFLFLFLLDNEKAHDATVTWQVTWYDIIEFKTWWKNLEDDVRAHIYNMVALSRKWGKHEMVA